MFHLLEPPPSPVHLLCDHAGLRRGLVLHLRPPNDHVLDGRYGAYASAPAGVLLRGQPQPGTNGPIKTVDFRSGKSQVRLARRPSNFHLRVVAYQ